MNVVIVGAGSVGMLLATFLAEVMEVTVVVKREEQLRNIEQHGLWRKNLDGTVTKVSIRGLTALDDISENSLIIVAVKYNQLQELYPKLRKLPYETPILFVQNGLAHFEEALSLPQETIAFGSCLFGAQKENEYTVIHRGIGVLKLAVERGNGDTLQSFYKVGSNLFPVEFVENAEGMLFEKALFNCFINPLTAILNVKNGELIKNEHTKQLLQELYEELMTAFPEQKKSFSFKDVVTLCEKTATNTSSMLQDRLLNKKTEVESIVGAVIKKAEQKGQTVPLLKTLYRLVLALEGEKM
ncbi:MAG: 2-dehydropantoate 2-reductase [Lysinibacillus sp.]|nr:2-dehydropantoate 2-reductase [Lysinibacillus sp.]